MTTEDIKKALECYLDAECYKCPLLKDSECRTNLVSAIIDLIDRKQAEIERLNKEVETEIDKLNAEKNDVMYYKDQIKSEAIKEFEEKSEKILIELYEKYHKIANKPKKETDMFYLFYQGRAEAIWECITANRNLVKEMTTEYFNRNEGLVDKIATFLEREENWIALKHCWIYSGRSEDLRKLLRQALQG